jgi:prolyl oligopeptidase
MSIGDFIACAEYLIQRGFTSPAHLGAEGGSAGAIVAGGALTQRPDLFAAVVLHVGVNDMLRIWTTPAGPPNVPEFGLITDSVGFKGLLGVSAYQHVKDKAAYPAVLLAPGSNDPRVAPWQSAKMAARLQAATTSGRAILLRVDYDAGHGSVGSTTSQRVASRADVFTFLLWQLGQPE